MNEYMVKRIDREEYDARPIRATSPELAAEALVHEDEQSSVEFEIAAGHESAIVEVEGHGQFEVKGDPRPHYYVLKVTCAKDSWCGQQPGHDGPCDDSAFPF